MLDKNLVAKVLLKALSTGGDFAEIFVEKSQSSSISMGDNKINHSSSSLSYGVGIRLFKDLFYSYAYTNDVTESGLLKAAAKVSEVLKENSLIKNINLVSQSIENKHNISINPLSVAKSEKVDILRIASEIAYKESSKIKRIDTGITDKIQEVLIANSEGLWVEDTRIRTHFGLTALAEEGEEKFSLGKSFGALKGFEFFKSINVEEMASQCARTTIEMLKAENCPAGKMPVVVARELGGILFHEACGHSLEATLLAKNASVFNGKLGQQIASPLVNLIDDGTLPNHWGSTNVDDEGRKTQRNVLIENGILKGYLIDKFNGRKMGMEATGSARRQSYKMAPTSRMNNTFLANGKSSPEEIIAETKQGIYVEMFGNGSVNPTSDDFNFSVKQGYLIENGKLTKPIKGAKLIGKGAEILPKIDMVGNDWGLHGGGQCGSKSGWVPVCHGQPTLRVSEMIVGGQK